MNGCEYDCQCDEYCSWDEKANCPIHQAISRRDKAKRRAGKAKNTGKEKGRAA